MSKAPKDHLSEAEQHLREAEMAMQLLQALQSQKQTQTPRNQNKVDLYNAIVNFKWAVKHDAGTLVHEPTEHDLALISCAHGALKAYGDVTKDFPRNPDHAVKIFEKISEEIYTAFIGNKKPPPYQAWRDDFGDSADIVFAQAALVTLIGRYCVDDDWRRFDVEGEFAGVMFFNKGTKHLLVISFDMPKEKVPSILKNTVEHFDPTCIGYLNIPHEERFFQQQTTKTTDSDCPDMRLTSMLLDHLANSRLDESNPLAFIDGCVSAGFATFTAQASHVSRVGEFDPDVVGMDSDMQFLNFSYSQILMQVFFTHNALDHFAQKASGSSKEEWDRRFITDLGMWLKNLDINADALKSTLLNVKRHGLGEMAESVFEEDEDFVGRIHLAVIGHMLALVDAYLVRVPFPYKKGHDWDILTVRPVFNLDPAKQWDPNIHNPVILMGFIADSVDEKEARYAILVSQRNRDLVQPRDLLELMTTDAYPLKSGQRLNTGQASLHMVPDF